MLIADPTTSTPTPYGLLSVANQPPNDGPYWQGGVTWQAMCVTGLGSTYDECLSPVVTGGGASPAASTLQPNIGLILRGASPFTVYVDFECSPVGNTEAQAKAETAMQQGGAFQVERTFWTGLVQDRPGQTAVAGVFPHLADDTQQLDGSTFLQTVPVTGGSATTDIAEALGYLEDQIARCSSGGAGVIHVPTVALATLDAWGLVKVQGQTLQTLRGNLVAVGDGYPGTAPSGAPAAAGTTWMYATGPVFAMASQTRVTPQTEAMDRTENTLKMIAQRNYVLGWDCCHAGVLVKLGVPYSGTDAG